MKCSGPIVPNSVCWQFPGFLGSIFAKGSLKNEHLYSCRKNQPRNSSTSFILLVKYLSNSSVKQYCQILFIIRYLCISASLVIPNLLIDFRIFDLSCNLGLINPYNKAFKVFQVGSKECPLLQRYMKKETDQEIEKCIYVL